MGISPESSEQNKTSMTFMDKKQELQDSQKRMLNDNKKVKFDDQNKQIVELNKLLDRLNPQLKGWHRLAFVLLGIASLAGWNAILSAIDFFQAQYPKDQFMDVSYYFPVPIMLSNCLAAFVCPALARVFSLNQRIAYTLMGTCLTIVSVNMIAIFFNTQMGFWISFIILIIQGFIDCVNTSSLISLSGMVDPTLNNTYWTCTAFSGLTTNFLRMITLAWFGDGQSAINTGSALYFSISAFVYVISSTLQVLFADSEYFHIILKRQKVYSKIEEIKRIQVVNSDLQQQTTAQNLSQIYDQQTQKIKILSTNKQNPIINYFLEIKQVFQYAGAIPVFISIIYIQTFMVFPGISIFQKSPYHIFSQTWAQVVMITIFNLGDVIGKFSGFYKPLHKLYFVYSIVLLRFIFFSFFIITAKREDLEFFQNDFFAMINMFVFALANGFGTTALMNLGTKNTSDPKITDLINYYGGFAIAFGIMIGTFLSLPLNSFVDS
ncbi:hypothetical protein ABPG72_016662 [Tetrahymena utriculariae]